MAAESLLPLFHENPAGHMSDRPSDNDDVLAELLGGAGDDLLASLLEPGSAYLGQLSPPPFPSPSLPTPPPTVQPSASDAHSTHDTDISDRSSLNTAHSPYSGSNVSCSPDTFGLSPEYPGDVMMTSTDILPTDELDALLGSLATDSYGGTSSEIKINVESGLGVRGEQLATSAVTSGGSLTASSSSRKGATLVLTEEEKQLLTAEGVELPTDMPLTKTEQKHLKKVQRKIKNKLSAQESRRRKKEYVEGLEERVQCCTGANSRLRRRVDSLETENKSLLQQLEKLRSIVAHLYPSKLQAGTLLLVLSLSFSLLVFPWPRPPGSPSSHTVTVHSRTLLFTDTDEFGNIIDPESGTIVSQLGGLSPKPPYPWSMQTPAFLSTLTDTLNPKPSHTKGDL